MADILQNNFSNSFSCISLRWRHNGRDGVSNHQPHDCLLNRLFRRASKKTSKLPVTGLCVGNSPGTGEFPAQMASNAEKIFHLMTSSFFFIGFYWKLFPGFHSTITPHWCRYWLSSEEAARHCLNPWWPRLMMHKGVTIVHPLSIISLQ